MFCHGQLPINPRFPAETRSAVKVHIDSPVGVIHATCSYASSPILSCSFLKYLSLVAIYMRWAIGFPAFLTFEFGLYASIGTHLNWKPHDSATRVKQVRVLADIVRVRFSRYPSLPLSLTGRRCRGQQSGNAAMLNFLGSDFVVFFFRILPCEMFVCVCAAEGLQVRRGRKLPAPLDGRHECGAGRGGDPLHPRLRTDRYCGRRFCRFFFYTSL